MVLLAFSFLAIAPTIQSLSRADAAGANPKAKPVHVTVDARDILRRIVTSKLVIPAKPGPLTLHFPKWIPGTHAPLGPVSKLAGLKLWASGKPITWKRNSLDLFAFDCDVPAGVDAIEAELLYVLPARSESLEVSLGVVASNQMAILNWNSLVLYPDGIDQTKIEYEAKLLVAARMALCF